MRCEKIQQKDMRIFRIPLICLDDSLALNWQYLNQLNEVITWKGLKYKAGPS